MAAINQKAINRVTDGLKKFQPIINNAKTRDINESDTVVLITDILTEVFGYDKYNEITTEAAVKNTYCDLAIKINNEIKIYIEAKAIGVELKDAHIQQAVDYATRGGIDWAVLTNGINWKIYRVVWGKPVTTTLVYEFNFPELKARNDEDIDKLSLLCKEALPKNLLEEHFSQRQATSRFMLGNLIFEDAVINCIRKELKEVYPDLKCSNEEIAKIIRAEVVKREIIEGDEAAEAQKKINRANKKIEKAKAEKARPNNSEPPVELSTTATPSEE